MKITLRDMDGETLFKKIALEHKKQLKNLSFKNKKLIICFSAIPGSGKTYISKILEERYRAVRINNDNIRKVIKDLVSGNSEEMAQRRQEILQEYLVWLIKNYKFKNGLIILDSSVDRKHELVKKIASEIGFKVFTIQIKLDKEAAIKRAVERNDGKEDLHFVSNLNRWIRENKNFSKQEKIDFVVVNDEKLNLSGLFSKLDKLIC